MIEKMQGKKPIKKPKRFKLVLRETLDISSSVVIIEDTETGVQYLGNTLGYSGGLTPLLDGNGKPVIGKSES